MKRLELFEFEDFNWFPSYIRTGMTNLIKVLHRWMGTKDVLADLILGLQQKFGFTTVIDLGSGSGGPMIETIEKVNNQNSDQPLELFLSDKFPNPETVQRINDSGFSNVEYLRDSVDASKLESLPKGLKTMIASFHHMPPKVAKAILSSAAKSKEPILIYEITENNIPTLVWWLFLPISLLILILMTLVMTPFVRPLTLSQLVFTYLIPIIPIAYAWDGQASLMRTYTAEDIKILLEDIDGSSYRWEIETAKKENGKKAGYYILGYFEDSTK
jgi:hypothetical protein